MAPRQWGRLTPVLALCASSSTDRPKSCQCCTASVCIPSLRDYCGWRERSPPTFSDEARTAQSSAITVLGHRLSASVCFNLGEFLTSRVHLEQGLALYDPGHRPFYMSLQIQDPRVELARLLLD